MARVEPDVDRLWAGVNARRSARATRRRIVAKVAPLLVVVAALVVIAFVSLRRRSEPSAGPLALSSGPVPSSFVAASNAATDVRFADGSDLTLAPGSIVEVLENTGNRFVTALRSGGGTFDVQPGGPRRWEIESGHVRVEVVGTKFVVERRLGVVHVAVDRGVVVVRGDRVPDGVQRLTAGSSLDVVDDAITGAASTSSSPAIVASAPPPPPPAIVAPEASIAPAVTASVPPSPSAIDPVDALLHDAEIAEKEQHVDVAIEKLRAVVAKGANDARSAVAAFSLARLLLAGHPAEAASVLKNALDRGVPKALEEDARARLVEAYAASGSHDAASAAAADYLARYPNGAHRQEVERWSETK